MSIYATWWEIAVPIYVLCDEAEKGAEVLVDGGSNLPCRERFIQVFAQAVPAHIGHPSEYDVDYYADFLPPVMEHDQGTPRAVFIIDEDHCEKDGQRYVNPLLMLTGKEYEAATFGDLLDRIENALEERFGVRNESGIMKLQI